MKCSKCQTENPEGNTFCRKCGAKLILVCPSCGSEYITGDKFCGKCGQKLEEVTEMPPETPQSAIEGARKQATVLFSDLVGYTVISERLDPEEVKEIMSRIFGEIAQVVAKYEGFIDKFIGDSVLAFFGVPTAHEDDPVRAIRAAREIHDLVQAMSPKLEARIGQPLVMHSGINTGLVVTGEFGIGKGGHAITGDTINLASRLTGLAKAGEILVASDIYRLTEGYFTFQDLGLTDIKGKAEPVQAYKVLSARERPLTIHRLSGLKSDLIGRKVEIARLGEAVERLHGGKSTIFSIYGDAGTGKSRLIEEFKATLNLEEIQWLEAHAYAYCQNTPYFPFIDMMNRTWQIREGDSPEKVREKLESGIDNVIGKREDVIPYIGSLYSLNYPQLEGIDPESWKSHLYKAMLEILSGVVQRKPTVIFLEDLHWADPSSLELVRYLSSELRYPALILCAYRPYFGLFASHQMAALGNSYQEIHLQDLSPTEVQDMMGSLLKTSAVPPELRQFTQEKAEGNPFYLEEVVNSLIESEMLIRDNGGWKLTKSLSEYGLSGTIHGIISARLDYLEKDVKRTLQEASVIGRAFLYTILKAVTEFKEGVDQNLNDLEKLDLIRTRSLEPELEYIFKHALTQEVVYNGLLKKERAEIHQRIGIVMEQLFCNRLPEFYESLAFHFKQSPSILKAVDYLVKSGEKSTSRYATEESHQYFKDAFDLLANKLDKSREENALLIDLLFGWADVFYYRGDFKGMTELLSAHKDLAESLDDKARLGMFYARLGEALHYGGRYRDAYQYLRRALKLGEEIENQRVIGYACASLSWTCEELGRLDESILFGERAKEITELFPADVWLYVNSFAAQGLSYFYRGDTKKTLEIGRSLLDYGDRHSNIRISAIGYFITGMGYLVKGDFQSLIESSKKGIQISRDPFYGHSLRMLLGLAYAFFGQYEEAEDTLQEVVTYSQKFGADSIGTMSKLYLGVALMAKGNMGQGLALIEEAQRSYLENGRKSLYLQCEYMLGKVYLQMVERAAPIKLSTIVKNIGFIAKNVPFADKKAESHFNKAIEVARQIGAKSALGWAYLDLGLLHKAKGRTDKARECLSNAIQLFEQCEMEVYLRQARETLASLG